MIEIPLKEVNAHLLQAKEDLKKLEYPFFAYHVFDYAFDPFWEYICRYARTPKKTVFLGINPGPFGMMQNGIPFGTISIARDWLLLRAPIKRPSLEHPKRPIRGWAEPREEESGARLWGLARREFKTPQAFFKDHLILNYCPIGFIDGEGKNVTPDKLPEDVRIPMEKICDDLFSFLIDTYQVQTVLGVGRYAEKQAQKQLANHPSLRVEYVPHPSPLNPQAYALWIKEEGEAMRVQLKGKGIW